MNNGECDHKCRSGGDGSALCYCLRGYRLGTDGTTCEGTRSSLIMGGGGGGGGGGSGVLS